MKAFCIYGPPGTGKTSELMTILSAVLDRNDPATVCFLSHTRSAAREAVSRANLDKMPKANISTIHSLCYRYCGISRDQVITSDRLREFGKIVNVPITGKNPDSDKSIQVGDEMIAIISLSRNTREKPIETYMKSDRPGSIPTFKMFCKAYESWKLNYGLVDFSDMLCLFVRTSPPVPYKALIIDEAQDLSPLQWAVIRTVAKTARLLYIAGDDDQAIFVWGGADSRGMIKFEEQYDAQRKILDQSHRVPPKVHDLANSIIRKVSSRIEKTYRPLDGVRDRVDRHSDDLPNERDVGTPALLLYRDISARRRIEDALLGRCVPYKTRTGFPGPYQNKYGRAIKALQKLNQEGPKGLGIKDQTAIKACLNPQNQLKNLEDLKGKAWRSILKVPDFLYWYYQNVDIEAEPIYTLSTIHGVKGNEADRVIINTGMSERTQNSYARDPDQEHRVWYVGVTRTKRELDICYGFNSYEL